MSTDILMFKCFNFKVCFAAPDVKYSAARTLPQPAGENSVVIYLVILLIFF